MPLRGDEAKGYIASRGFASLHSWLTTHAPSGRTVDLQFQPQIRLKRNDPPFAEFGPGAYICVIRNCVRDRVTCAQFENERMSADFSKLLADARAKIEPEPAAVSRLIPARELCQVLPDAHRLRKHGESETRAEHKISLLLSRCLELQEWLEEQVLPIVIRIRRLEDGIAGDIDAASILCHTIHILKREIEHEAGLLSLFCEVEHQPSAHARPR